MNKAFLYSIILGLFLINPLQAQQNIVYNGDFELYSDCPNTVSYPTQAPFYEITKCLGWMAPTYGTSDYFNVCATNSVVGVPSNSVGEQVPFNGNGYLGAFFFSKGGAGWDGYAGYMWWEYIQGSLLQPLEQGKMYKFSMEISLAEYSDLYINEIGVYFSNTPISSPNSAALSVVPQIVFHEPNYYQDTLNWVHLEAFYIANGGEQYLTIGNFNNDASTDTLRRYNLEPMTPNPFVSYFYIDDVMLVEAEDVAIPNVFTPNNDGVNDFWICPIGVSNEEVFIYNRWGKLITTDFALNYQWNGKSQDGVNCSEGIYYYILNKTNKTGFIHLMR